MIATAKGYRSIFTVLEDASAERRAIMMALGGEMVLSETFSQAIEVANELAARIPNSFIPRQVRLTL